MQCSLAHFGCGEDVQMTQTDQRGMEWRAPQLASLTCASHTDGLCKLCFFCQWTMKEEAQRQEACAYSVGHVEDLGFALAL